MMDLTAQESVNAEIYLENFYQGDLDAENLATVESIPWEDWLQTWLNALRQSDATHEMRIQGLLSRSTSEQLAENYEISLRLTSDSEIQELNQQYRFKDQPTDVLAFAATEAEIPLPPDLSEPIYLGDIIISLDTAVKQAKSQNHSLTTELAWLASHGLLHLLGWDHPDDQSLNQMLQRQSELIQIIGLKTGD